MTKGWDTLNMYISSECDNEEGYYLIGYLEGILTYKKMRYLWRNYIADNHFGVKDYSQNGIDDNKRLKDVYGLMDKISTKFKKEMEWMSTHDDQ